MIAVIFEATPTADGRDAYLQWAARLAETLPGVDGFLSIERFQSLARPDALLSLSFWRDEEAVAAWRNLESHRAAQAAGRGKFFADYRLRVAAVVRDYGMDDRAQAPGDSRAAHSG
ncbi:antibiotic biosynthesis monooxygenase [Chromobacterium subtsugae]|uniref:Antibiotic biosynthesis monooxygenase n=1 Tax=Chromobacterium subtsugae TaxID=251747 RepID=A0ABS7FJ17_9NEIS|nr:MULTISPECIES: antibiotic biosynthesis monooxygenase [Chromobacterium]KUM01644.1 antibiotic biosynthesis monooxygenase [Chromobacterium subtsugae]KZE85323.1 antibiotic biosynthesis monooxygenase [Chromobacterium sp. F49]MBW7568901.1 antibiotic biosynthesis monooxygenase [Chromobacterium subtsugae]MBW8290039.1 antibiotic biosynthesis monooxygenase [Chromobacterium subtsugae]OBU84489.1 antibiotic biosynthesis monooxygenase [Chromobacterium subtsugae]